MINSRAIRNSDLSTEEKLIKLLEGIDWKLWEIYNMLKHNLPEKDNKEDQNKE